MNILHALYQCRTGAGALQVVVDLARSARAQGYGVTVLGPTALEADAPEVERFFTGNKILDGWRLARYLYRKRCDIVHVHDRYCSLLVSLIPQAPPSVQTNQFAYRTHRRLTRFAQCVVGCSEAMDRHHAEFFGLPASRRTVIPNGVSFRQADLAQASLLHTRFQGWVRGRRLCLTVARLAYQKGHIFLLEAIARLPPTVRSGWCFVLAGEGELEPQLRAQAERLAIVDEILFLGHTTQVPEWLSLAEAFVLPSRYEGLPLALLEAMAAGLPCLGTAIDGIREVLVEGKNGLLCRPEDPEDLCHTLETLLANQPLRRRLGPQARADYERSYTLERTWQAYEALYRRLLLPTG
ncbi:glycosyltransferase family 4 protein [Anthocerotibacter panamensis]|uniref:glycosyltransferase family 4 protein n=1 Tax=Anthocerotibacter panamensis TaxID=2857077 RepID=UPI001C407EDB|nr:glycosyltransferase family 4 protein [Anthocerotibacter panamensis]